MGVLLSDMAAGDYILKRQRPRPLQLVLKSVSLKTLKFFGAPAELDWRSLAIIINRHYSVIFSNLLVLGWYKALTYISVKIAADVQLFSP